MEVGDVLADRFVVEARASQGGLGVVYRGWDLEAERPIAIKVLAVQSASDIQRFHREAALLAELRLPGIVEYISSGTTPDGADYLVMEWLAGETVAARLERVGFDVADTVSLVRAVCGPLDALHFRGVIHRDVKPENLILGDQPDDVRLIDLGLARAESPPVRITATGVVLGTPGYMAPEQVRGEPLDSRADIFALGCLLYECLTGYAAFAGENYLAVRSKILVSTPPPLESLCPEAPAALVRLVATMITKDRDLRPPSTSDVAAALAALGPLPPGTRRRWNAPRPPTLPTLRMRPDAPAAAADWTGVLLVQTAKVTDSTVEQLDTLRVVVPAGGTLECLSGGFVLVTVRGALAHDAAPQLARCALALRDQLPDAHAAIATGTTALDDLVDQASRLLDHAVRAAVFHARGGVVVDEATATALSPSFAVERRAGCCYLAAPAS